MLRRGIKEMKFLFCNCILLLVVLIYSAGFTGTVDIQIKGIDDGIKTTKQQDYKEAVLFAKREAVERAGVEIKSITTVRDMVVNSDYIESEAEAALMPGYNLIDMGYSADGTYQIVLVGKVKLAVSELIESKELRYAKSLYDMGKKMEAKNIVNDIIKNSKDDSTVAEAMYYQVLWLFSSDDAATYIKLKAYYPDSQFVTKLKNLIDERRTKKKREIAEKKEQNRLKFGLYELVEKRRDQFLFFKSGVVVDTKTNLMWAIEDIKEDWIDANRYLKKLTLAGFNDWRFPRLHEIATLQNPKKIEKRQLKRTLGEIVPPWSYNGNYWAVSADGYIFEWWFGRAKGARVKEYGEGPPYLFLIPVRDIN